MEVYSPPHETQQRYIFGEKLGEGSFGEAFICTHKVTGDVFACKKLRKSRGDIVHNYRVKREITILKKLSHPNIVTLKDCYQDDEAFYLVMDMCSGGTLKDQIKVKGRYTETEAASVTRQIVEALKICHEHGVIHHDLDPDNIMFIDESNLKLIDFGLSMMFKPGERLDCQHYGNPYYRAPELFMESDYGPEIDVWSAGVILYQLLYGTLPFHPADNCKFGREKVSLGVAVINGVKDFNWKQILPGISEDAIDLLKKMLAKKGVRITAKQVLAHPWIQNGNYGSTSSSSRN